MLLLFLPLLTVGAIAIQQGLFHLHANMRRRSSRRAFETSLRRWRTTAGEDAAGSESIARLAAILPGNVRALYELRAGAGLRLLHLTRDDTLTNEALAQECASMLEHKYEIKTWIDSLQSLDSAAAVLRDCTRLSRSRPQSEKYRARLRAVLWPWRAQRLHLYLTRLGPPAAAQAERELWAAGFYDDRTHVPPGHTLEEEMRGLFRAKSDAAQNNHGEAAATPAEAGLEFFQTSERDALKANRDAQLARLIHDVRLPMTRLFAMLENLQIRVRAETPGESPAIEQSFARIERQLRTMESFTYDILNLENSGAADRNAKAEALDLAERLRQIVDAHIDLIERKQITVAYEFPESGPTVIADPMALDRILFNLLTNSFQFCSNPGQLYLSLEARPRHVVLDIEDSGPGLASQENTFELSRRNIGRGGSGWGIGLASARDLSRRLGGRLFATRPRRGKGARFLLVLPGVPVQSGKR